MPKRFISIWFRYLRTDWFTRRHPHLSNIPFVLASPDHGRIIITAANHPARQEGINIGMAVADARAIVSSLEVMDDMPELPAKLLSGIAGWCIRFTPVVAIDPPDGLILDVTGCAHLWGNESNYLTEILKRLKGYGYEVRAAMADTIGAAWAIARYGDKTIVDPGNQMQALLLLPPHALRLDPGIVERLVKLGLRQLSSFISLPRSALRRRFGEEILQRLDQASGQEEEFLLPVQPLQPYEERLPSLEPIVTATGIVIALERLLHSLCNRLQKEEKGLRASVLKCYRVDGKIGEIRIGTHRPSSSPKHLFKLFESKINSIEPALGIELFTLNAMQVEDLPASQEELWNMSGMKEASFSELIDRLAGKLGPNKIQRFIPDEHYWPERSFKPASSIHEKLQLQWEFTRPRPIRVLSTPEAIEVTAPIPDYPPMLFRYRGKLHKIIKADGPERIEQEWWLQNGQHRDYYNVEDEEGCRYWLFRSGHYGTESYQWFIHGFFA